MRKNFMKKGFKTSVVALALLAASMGQTISFSEGQIAQVTMEAAVVSCPVPISCYPLGSGRLTTYTDSKCSKVSGYIEGSDLCKILQISSNGTVVKVSYPTSKGAKTAYAKMNGFFKSTNFTNTKKTGVKLKVFGKSTGKTVIGTVYSSDVCVVITKSNSRTQIIYPLDNGGYKAGWIDYSFNKIENNKSNNDGSNKSSLDKYIGKTIANINSSYYTKQNLSYNGGYKGQCTWYSYGRFMEITGIKLKTAPNGGKWLEANRKDKRVKVYDGASNIRPKSIAVRTSGKWGHAFIVEDVTYNKNGTPAYVYFTECNADGNGRYDAGIDCILKKLSYKQFVSQKNPAGYIVAK